MKKDFVPDPPSGPGTSTPLEVFPIALGKYDHHEDLDVEAEVTKIAAILADFGGYEVPWLAAMADRGADTVNARLRAWSRPRAGEFDPLLGRPRLESGTQGRSGTRPHSCLGDDGRNQP